MKKTVNRMYHNIINRVSVLMTVFSVLVCSCLYNPASLAADYGVLTFESFKLWLNGDILWNGDSGQARTWFVPSDGYSYFCNIPFVLYGSGDLINATTESQGYFSKSDIRNLNGSVTLQFKTSFEQSLGSVLKCQIEDVTISGNPSGISASYYYFNPNGWLTFNFIDYNFDPSIPSRIICSGNVRLRFYISGGSYNLNQNMQVMCYLDGITSGCSANLRMYHVSDSSAIGIGSNVESINSNVDTIKNGYDSSAGSSAQSALDSSLSGADQQSTSLFTSASSTLSGFSFTDISAFSAVASGLSFVSSTMSSIYEALGGVNGAGVVLSVGCSVLFVSFVIGAYKFYSGKKGG